MIGNGEVNHLSTKTNKMIHQDFYKKYRDIRSEEVNALNETIRNTDDKEVY